MRTPCGRLYGPAGPSDAHQTREYAPPEALLGRCAMPHCRVIVSMGSGSNQGKCSACGLLTSHVGLSVAPPEALFPAAASQLQLMTDMHYLLLPAPTFDPGEPLTWLSSGTWHTRPCCLVCRNHPTYTDLDATDQPGRRRAGTGRRARGA